MKQFNKHYTQVNGKEFSVRLDGIKAGSTKAFCYRTVVINNVDTISIEFNYGVANPDSVKRALFAIESYANSNGRYYCILDNFEHGQIETITKEIISKIKYLQVEVYNHHVIKYISVEGAYESKRVKFVVFNKEMMIAAALRFDEIQRDKAHKYVSGRANFLTQIE